MPVILPPQDLRGDPHRDRVGIVVTQALARDAELVLERDQRRAELHQLRAQGAYIEGTVRRTSALAPAPEVDRAYFRELAAANTANAGLNELPRSPPLGARTA